MEPIIAILIENFWTITGYYIIFIVALGIITVLNQLLILSRNTFIAIIGCVLNIIIVLLGSICKILTLIWTLLFIIKIIQCLLF